MYIWLMHFGDEITLPLRLKQLADIAHQAAHQSRRRRIFICPIAIA